MRLVHNEQRLDVENNPFLCIKLKQSPRVLRLEMLCVSLLVCPSAKDVVSDIVSDRLEQIVVFTTFFLYCSCMSQAGRMSA